MPPHFHSKYSGYEITVDIYTGVVEGRFQNELSVMFWSGMRSTKKNCWKIGSFAKNRKLQTPLIHWSSEMFLHILDAKHVDNYKLEICLTMAEKGLLTSKVIFGAVLSNR